MLTDDQKKAIKEQEIYREEVRKQLSFKENKNRALNFLETQSGLFIASAVILPLILWVYSLSVSHYQIQAEKETLKKSIDVEISYRVAAAKQYLQGDIDIYLAELDSKHAFPQFTGVRMYALLSLLESEVPDCEKQSIIAAKNSVLTKEKSKIISSFELERWK